ncbi:FCS-Like Zinc finger 2 [Camellia lanceoleosa]|uniref:FCS-Like Zinc finger 2 n=1 Tax=Camellia lanceoleosa TaxID=1840588 RepID=A0ACC0FSD8_9ERIC|nr:FCS-Like Zinc finger 2 [Camellia lanceoleosa]
MEAGFSGNNHHHHYNHPFFSRPLRYASSHRRGSMRSLSSFSGSPRSGRGDTPFCSEECRQEQIEIDETKEKKSNVSDSMKALRKDQKRKSKSASPNKVLGEPIREEEKKTHFHVFFFFFFFF